MNTNEPEGRSGREDYGFGRYAHCRRLESRSRAASFSGQVIVWRDIPYPMAYTSTGEGDQMLCVQVVQAALERS